MDIRRLSGQDLRAVQELLDLFGEVFQEPETYGFARPFEAYQRALLDNPGFVALALYSKLGRREDIHHFDIAVD